MESKRIVRTSAQPRDPAPGAPAPGFESPLIRPSSLPPAPPSQAAAGKPDDHAVTTARNSDTPLTEGLTAAKMQSTADAADATDAADAADAADAVIAASGSARLDELWYQCWRAIGARGDGQASFEQLLAAHSDPARRVHGVEYLLDCFAYLRRWRSYAERFDALSLAIWYHDAFLDPQRHDNEARSARLAAEHLSGSEVPADTVRLIRDLIISTRPGEKATSGDARLLNDIDRALLAASPEAYDRYERQLRYENSHIGDFIYRRKRIEYLQSTLSKTQIYSTDFAHAELDAAARENLRRWLQIWQQSAKPIAPESEPQSMLCHTI